MKSVVLLFSILVSPALLSAQSTLTFARTIEGMEMASTGIAVVNPSPVTADVTFTLFSSSGAVIGTTNLSVPASGQLARSANEIFPNAQGGWVQARSSVTALRGFWLFGDSVTYADVAEAAPSAADLIIPLMTDVSDLTIINTDGTEAAVLIRIYGQAGQELAEPVVRVLPANGSFRSASVELFDPPDWSAVGHVEVTSSVSLAASVTVRDYRVSSSLVALNGVGVPTPAADLVFPHVVHGRVGASDYISVISVTNASASSQSVTLTLFPEGGSSGLSVHAVLKGKATLRMNAQRLFGFSGFQNGWVRVTSGEGLVGFAVNYDNEAGGSTATPGDSRSQTSLLFGHIANLSPWWTGLALVNPGPAAASVQIIAIDPNGAVIGSTTAVIPASGRTTRLLGEWIPAMQARTSDGGFVFVNSASPLYGLALFFTRDLRILSSVPAFDLPPTVPNPGQ